MNRRNFLRNSSVAGITVATVGVGAYGANKKSPSDPVDVADDFILNEITLEELQGKMKSGTMTSKSITELYLKRIAEIDKNGPTLNSVIEVNPDALSIAEGLDRERKEGKIRGPLHGIPILIKDNIDTADRMMTTAGSLALKGNYAKEDAFIVQQLRKAGVVILGKTNLSEWANFRSTRSTSGWSSRGGQTRNPNILDRNPCGSSSGSGAAVSANLCAFAIGTETDGSIIAPSSFCGIVGIKPTVGLVSRAGIIPISKTQDTAGPMTRTVKDAAIVLGALEGYDSNDPITKESNGMTIGDYTRFLNADGLKGVRIGIEKSHLEGHEGVVQLLTDAINALKSKGAVVVEVELLKQTRQLGRSEFAVLQYEFKDGLNKYLSGTKGSIRSLSDVIAFNKKNETTAMPFFKQETLESSNEKGDLNTPEYREAVAKTTEARKIITDLMTANQLDVICAVSIGPAGLIDLVNGDYDTGFYFCPPAAMAGYPHITVPMGTVQQLPLGLSFIAKAYQESKLLTCAYAYEQASKKRTPPKFIKSSLG